MVLLVTANEGFFKEQKACDGDKISKGSRDREVLRPDRGLFRLEIAKPHRSVYHKRSSIF